MRVLPLALVTVLVACGGHGETEPGDPSTNVTSPTPYVEPTPTGARPLSPDEPQLPALTSTGGGPGSPSVSGAARAAQPLLLRCYVDSQRAGAAHESYLGTLHLGIDEHGVVTVATVRLERPNGAPAAPPSELVECLERTGRGLQFPPSPGGNQLELPLSFTGGEP